MQAFAFTNSMASVCLSVLQIHIWLSKLICWPPTALSSSVWPVPLIKEQSHTHCRIIWGTLSLGIISDVLLGKCPESQQLHRGAGCSHCLRYLQVVLMKVTDVFSQLLSGEPLASTWWPVLLQFMSVEVSGNSMHWKGQKAPWETGPCDTALGMVCLSASQQPFTFGQIDLTIPIYPNLLQLKMISFFWAVKTAEISQ